MLILYRQALLLRRSTPGSGDGPLHWPPASGGVLAFGRTDGLMCVVNLAEGSVELPPHRTLLLGSGPLDGDGRLPSDTAVWLRA
ncbi:hypothetical protein GCM10010272_33620 [Streptomyces lateritius]|nr:hypothetical protein GCM10010272_33620 [Streptomyces lateritius]